MRYRIVFEVEASVLPDINTLKEEIARSAISCCLFITPPKGRKSTLYLPLAALDISLED